MEHDVFVSYSSKNFEIAQLIFDKLVAESVKCWMAPQSLSGGDEYDDIIDEAIRDCRIFVLVYSEQAVNSRWVNSELTLAFDYYKHIIPFKIDQTILEGRMKVKLCRSHLIDAFPEAASKISELVKSVQNILRASVDKSEINQTDNSARVLSFAQQFDYEDAVEFYKNREYEHAINNLYPLVIKGNSASQELLCRVYYAISGSAEDGILIRSINPSIKDKIEIVANSGSSWACFVMHCYAYKQNDYDLSLDYVKKAITTNPIGLAYIRLGTIYAWGLGVEVNTSHAMRCFRQAEEHGCPEAFYHIASMYRRGYAESGPNEKLAIEYYQRGIEQRDPKAIEGLMNTYIFADKYDEALTLLEKLADEDIEQIELYYGNYYSSLYFAHTRSDEDKKQAKVFLEIAKNKKNYSAYGELSFLYYYGDDDMTRAREYAEAGYLNGDSLSYMWLANYEREAGNYERAWDISLERYERFGIGAELLGQLFLEDGYQPKDFPLQMLVKYLEVDAKVGHSGSCSHLIQIFSSDEYGIKSIDKEMQYRKLAADQTIMKLTGDFSNSSSNDMSAIIDYARALLKEGSPFYDPRAGVKYLKQAVMRKDALAAKMLLHQYNWNGNDYQKKQYKKACAFVLKAGVQDRIIFYDLINSVIPEENLEDYLAFLKNAEIEWSGNPQLWENDYGLLNIYIKYLSGFFKEYWTLSDEHYKETKKKLVEHINVAPGCLSPFKTNLNELFPEYNRETGLKDFMDNNPSFLSQLFYAQSVDVDGEFYVHEQDRLLSKLMECVEKDSCSIEIRNRQLCLLQDDMELWRSDGAMENFNNSYQSVCESRNIRPIDDLSRFPYEHVFPFIPREKAVEYRKRVLRAFLSVILIDENLHGLLDIVNDSEKLLNYAEKIESDESLQLFIISFVEVDLDVSSLLIAGAELLQALAAQKLGVLVEFVNKIIGSIEESGIAHSIPPVTLMNLPVKSPHFFDDDPFLRQFTPSPNPGNR